MCCAGAASTVYCCQATLITIAILVTRPTAVEPIRVCRRLDSNADRLALWVAGSDRDQVDHVGRRSLDTFTTALDDEHCLCV